MWEQRLALLGTLSHLLALTRTNPQRGASLVAQMVKNPSAVQETWVRSLDQEDLLEKGMANKSSILTWRNMLKLCLSVSS